MISYGVAEQCLRDGVLVRVFTLLHDASNTLLCCCRWVGDHHGPLVVQSPVAMAQPTPAHLPCLGERQDRQPAPCSTHALSPSPARCPGPDSTPVAHPQPGAVPAHTAGHSGALLVPCTVPLHTANSEPQAPKAALLPLPEPAPAAPVQSHSCSPSSTITQQHTA